MDFSREEIEYMLGVAIDFKKKWIRKEPHEYLKGRVIAMIFEKPSTRTRVSFQAAVAHLGGQSFFLMPTQLQLSRGEPIRDTARVIDRYCDALVIRTFGQEIVEEYAKYMQNPVINALTDYTHPCQGLADLMTILEKKGRLQGIKLAYTGDIWNICHTLMIISSIFGINLYVARPEGYDPDRKVESFADKMSKKSGAEIVITTNLKEAVKDADVVYANTWHSMGGPEKEKEKRLKDFAGYQINSEIMKLAKKDAIFMHCLPCYRGEEVTDEVIEGPYSVVFDQAENRLHTEKAVLTLFVS